MEQKRVALLIGVSNYKFATRLRNPLNDVKSMDTVLSKLGFETIILKDPSFSQFKLALNQFGTKLNEYDVGLFYFAGHGIQVKGMNYLIPSDANPLNENQVEFDCINANQILSLMSDASNETNFIILDARRNNPFERSWHRSPTIQGLSYMSAPYGTLISYSTAPDKTASDGEGGNGLYTSVLIEEILSPNLTILQVLQNVRSQLIKISQGQQVPWESTSLLNDFVFNDNRFMSLSTYCQSIMYTHNRDIVLNNLKLNTWDLNKLSNLNIPITKEDNEAGIIEVYYKDKVNYFDVFNELELCLYENGERHYNLFTSTNDASTVYEISQALFNKLGGGLYDDETFSTFKEFDKIKNIARGKAKSQKEECFVMWIFENVTFTLKYSIFPKKQFLFRATVKPTKRVLPRTIKELFVNDYDSLLPSAVKIEPEDEHKGKFVDYYLSLTTPEFDFFDRAMVRLFAGKEPIKSTSIFLSNSGVSNMDINQISRLVAQITAIYGVDCSGDGYLTGIEEQNIKNNRFWTGRKWELNLQHQIFDTNSAGEEMLYGIHLYFYDELEGLQLSLYSYDRLLNYIKE